MEARLVYLVNGIVVELEKMEFEKLDDFTYANFDTEEDIINSSNYRDKLDKLPKNGEVRIFYNSFDMPVSLGEYFVLFGNDLFKSEQQSMSVLVKNRKIAPTKKSLRENILGSFTDMVVAEEFYELFEHFYDPFHKLMHLIGMASENVADALYGVKYILDGVMVDSDGYFAGRVFIEGVSRFNGVKNKDKNGNLYSPQLVKKN